MEADSIAGVEYCEPDDSGFTVAQLGAIRQLCLRCPNQYVWIAIGDSPDDFVTGHNRTQTETQIAVAKLFDRARVWLVQFPKSKEGKAGRSWDRAK